MGVRIGIFDHLDRGDTPLDEYYEARLRLVEAYDRAGFYSYHIAEHHATPLGMAPSPSIFLSAVAQRTKRLRFGPMVYLLPLYHPIRLAEEIAMLDNLSNGRLDVGIGRGISPIESTLYGRDPQENEERFNEVLDILKIAFSGGRIDYDGKHYTFHNVSMLLGTVQQPHPPFWYGISSPDSAERCVARDFNGVSLAATPKAATIAQRFRSAAHVANKPDLLVGIGRFIVVGETDAQALALARRAYPIWHDSFHYLYHAHGRSPVHGDRPRDVETMMELGNAVVGSPATVLAALQAQLDLTQANYVLGQFIFGDMTMEESLRSIDLFAREVMPQLDAVAIGA